MPEGSYVAVLLLSLSWLNGAPLAAAGSPPAVSPGHGTRIDRIDARCPTFIWGAVQGAERYELVVYRVDGPGGEPEVLLEETLPGSATAWTPALPSCLEPGGRYAWSVRSVAAARASEWSAPGATVGPGGLFSDGDVGIDGTLALATDVAPTMSPGNAVPLYAEDVGGSAELKVRDEAGNVTTPSPHDFSLVGGPSEPLAWSYYSENDHGRIHVDMLRTVRLVEELSGERLVHTETRDGSAVESSVPPGASLRAELEALRRQNEALERANRELEDEVTRIKAALGIE